jgi:hypothetical protein
MEGTHKWRFGKREEKMADTLVSVEAVADAAEDFSASEQTPVIIISGDRDQFPAMKAITRRFAHQAILAVPGTGSLSLSDEERYLDVRYIDRDFYKRSRMNLTESGECGWQTYRRSKEESVQVEDIARDLRRVLYDDLFRTFKNVHGEEATTWNRMNAEIAPKVERYLHLTVPSEKCAKYLTFLTARLSDEWLAYIRQVHYMQGCGGHPRGTVARY